MDRRPRTADERAAISAGQRRAWAERRRADDYRAICAAVFALESAPSRFPALLFLYRAAARIAPDVDRPRWERRLEVVAAGRRVRVSTFPAQVIAGDDLAALETIRSAATVADLLED